MAANSNFTSTSAHHDGSHGPTPTVLNADGAHSLTVPGQGFLLDADFHRSGPDLVLVGQDGHQVVITGYFSQATPPTLQTPGGAVITPDLASKLAGPMAPGQFAQAADTASDAAAQPLAAVGKVDKASGTVEVTHADGTRGVLHQGDPIYKGDVISTKGDESAVGIVFADASTFALSKTGRMVVDELAFDPESQSGQSALSVVKGTFAFESGQIAKTAPDAATIKTPVMTIGVRGTSGAGHADDSGGENTVVLLPDPDGHVGQVLVFNQSGVQVISNTFNQVAVLTPYQPPAPPVVLSPQQINQNYGHAIDNRPPAPPPNTPPSQIVPDFHPSAPSKAPDPQPAAPQQQQQGPQQQQQQGQQTQQPTEQHAQTGDKPAGKPDTTNKPDNLDKPIQVVDTKPVVDPNSKPTGPDTTLHDLQKQVIDPVKNVVNITGGDVKVVGDTDTKPKDTTKVLQDVQKDVTQSSSDNTQSKTTTTTTTTTDTHTKQTDNSVTTTTQTTTTPTVSTESGTVVDGYVTNATIFRDMNGDGIQQAGEYSTTSDASGHYTLQGSGGTIIVKAGTGTDSTTGQPLAFDMKAPPGSTVVTPLTTLIVAVMATGQNATAAEQQVKVMLGLNGITSSLTSLDPISAIGTAEGKAVLAATATTVASVNAIAAAFNNSGVSASDIMTQLAARAHSGSPVDLSDPTSLSTFVSQVAAAKSVSPPSTMSSVLTALAIANTNLSSSISTASNFSDVSTAIGNALKTDGPLAQILNDVRDNTLVANDAVSVQSHLATLKAAGITNFHLTTGTATFTAAQAAGLYISVSGSAVVDVIDTGANFAQYATAIHSGFSSYQMTTDATMTAAQASALLGLLKVDGHNITLTGLSGTSDALNLGVMFDTGHQWKMDHFERSGNDLKLVLKGQNGGTSYVLVPGHFDSSSAVASATSLEYATDGKSNEDSLVTLSHTADSVTSYAGTSGDDFIFGSTHGGTWGGGGGNDTIFYQGGANTFQGRIDGYGNGHGEVNFAAATTALIMSGPLSSSGSGSGTIGGQVQTFTGIREITGTQGDDVLYGRGSDPANSGNNFWINGGQGNDTIYDGGSGHTAASYSDNPGGVTVHLGSWDSSAGKYTGYNGEAIAGWGGHDTLYGIHQVEGSSFADTLYGSDGYDQFYASRGSDFIDGGDGYDQINYSDASVGVSVDLAACVGTHGQYTDTLINIENVAGTDFNDTLLGNGDSNYIIGLRGSDYIDGRGGADYVSYQDWNGDATHGAYVNLSGTAQSVVYSSAYASWSVNLAAHTAQDNWYDATTGVGLDTVLNIENVMGSDRDDVLIGSANTGNYLDGGAGNDYIDGLGGANNSSYDYVSGGAGNDTLVVRPYGYYDGGSGVDTLLFLNSAQGGSNSYNLSSISYLNIEAFKLSANVVLSADATQLTYGQNGGLYVLGSSSNTLNIGTQWVFTGTETTNGHNFYDYSYNGFALRVEQGINTGLSTSNPADVVVGTEDHATTFTLGTADPTWTGVTVQGAPNGTTLSVGGQTISADGMGIFHLTPAQSAGTITITPPTDWHGTFNLKCDAYINSTIADEGFVNVTINPVTDGATIGAPTSVNGTQGLATTFTLGVADSHYGETVDGVSISGAPVGATLQVGSTIIGADANGVFHLTAAQALGSISVNTPANYSGTFNLAVSAYAHDGNASSSVTQATIHVDVAAAQAVNHTPEITPYQATIVGSSTMAYATDADGDTLTYTFSTPTHGTISSWQSYGSEYFSYSASDSYQGLDSFTVTVTDGHGGTTTQTVEVITGANTAHASGAGSINVMDFSSVTTGWQSQGGNIAVAAPANADEVITAIVWVGAEEDGLVGNLRIGSTGDGAVKLVLSGTAAQINAQLAQLEYEAPNGALDGSRDYMHVLVSRSDGYWSSGYSLSYSGVALGPSNSFTDAMATGQWRSPGNWSSELVPDASSPVSIAGKSAIIDSTTTANAATLSIESANSTGGSLRVDGTLDLHNGDLSLDATSSLHLTASGTADNVRTATLAGSTDLEGTLTATTVTNTGALNLHSWGWISATTFSNTGDLTIGDGYLDATALTFSGTVTATGEFWLAGALSVDGGTTSIQGSIGDDSGGSSCSLTVDGGTVVVGNFGTAQELAQLSTTVTSGTLQAYASVSNIVFDHAITIGRNGGTYGTLELTAELGIDTRQGGADGPWVDQGVHLTVGSGSGNVINHGLILSDLDGNGTGQENVLSATVNNETDGVIDVLNNLAITGNITNSGTITLEGAQLRTGANSILANYGEITGSGTIQLDGGASWYNAGSLDIGGQGTLGTLTVNGDNTTSVAFGSTSSMCIDIDDSGCDHLLAGQITLGGELVLNMSATATSFANGPLMAILAGYMDGGFSDVALASTSNTNVLLSTWIQSGEGDALFIDGRYGGSHDVEGHSAPDVIQYASSHNYETIFGAKLHSNQISHIDVGADVHGGNLNDSFTVIGNAFHRIDGGANTGGNGDVVHFSDALASASYGITGGQIVNVETLAIDNSDPGNSVTLSLDVNVAADANATHSLTVLFSSDSSGNQVNLDAATTTWSLTGSTDGISAQGVDLNDPSVVGNYTFGTYGLDTLLVATDMGNDGIEVTAQAFASQAQYAAGGFAEVIVGAQFESNVITNIGSGDRVYGGANGDTFTVANGSFVSVDGGAGSDTLKLDAASVGTHYTLADGMFSNIETVQLLNDFQAGITTVDISAAAIQHNSGTPLNVLFDGRVTGTDTVTLGNGADGWGLSESGSTITATAGNASCTVNFGATNTDTTLIYATLNGNATVTAGASQTAFDTVGFNASSGTDMVVGAVAEHNQITNLAGADCAVGGSMNDVFTLDLTNGDSSFSGTIAGGAGNDVLVINNATNLTTALAALAGHLDGIETIQVHGDFTVDSTTLASIAGYGHNLTFLVDPGHTGTVTDLSAGGGAADYQYYLFNGGKVEIDTLSSAYAGNSVVAVVGSSGNDFLNVSNDDFNNVNSDAIVYGGLGDDTFHLNSVYFHSVDGGSGTDTIWLDSSRSFYNFDEAGHLSSIEDIHLNASSGGYCQGFFSESTILGMSDTAALHYGSATVETNLSTAWTITANVGSTWQLQNTDGSNTVQLGVNATNGNDVFAVSSSDGAHTLSVYVHDFSGSSDASFDCTNGVDVVQGAQDLNNTFNHIGAGDIVYGGGHDNTFNVDNSNFGSIAGGAGQDTIVWNVGGTLNLGSGGMAPGFIHGIETLALAGGDTARGVILDVTHVDSMTNADGSNNHTLFLQGGSNSAYTLQGFQQTVSSENGYECYTHTDTGDSHTTTVYVQNGMQQASA